MDEDLLENGPEDLAIEFLSNFIDVEEREELRCMEMTQALARMFAALVAQTLQYKQREPEPDTPKVLH